MIDDWGEFLILLRNGVLSAVADEPLYPWPGPPPGMEGLPSASYMGEDACMRKVWFQLLSRIDGEDAEYEALPRDGSLEVAPQRGWALEPTVRAWLSNAVIYQPGTTYRVIVHQFAGAVESADGSFYGHPDGWVVIYRQNQDEGELEVARMLLEIKHQRASAYMSFLKQGVAEAEPLYYAQVQALMAASGFDKTLFVITPFDVSSVKGNITMGKRGKNYSGELEPDFRMIPKSSGVNPAFYFEVVQAMPAYQRQLQAWAKAVVKHVRERTAPDRRYDVAKDWQCAYCDFRDACKVVGACKDVGCGHRGCMADPGGAEDGAEYQARG